MNEDKKRIKARDELSDLMAQEYSLVFVKSDLDLIIDCVLQAMEKAERAQWVNDIAAMGYNLSELPLHQLQSRADELNAFVIDEAAYAEQHENAINARLTSLNAVKAAIFDYKLCFGMSELMIE